MEQSIKQLSNYSKSMLLAENEKYIQKIYNGYLELISLRNELAASTIPSKRMKIEEKIRELNDSISNDIEIKENIVKEYEKRT